MRKRTPACFKAESEKEPRCTGKRTCFKENPAFQAKEIVNQRTSKQNGIL